MTETQSTEDSLITLQDILKLFKKTDERFKETDKQIKEMTKSIGALRNKWGEFVEGLVAPAALRLFRERGYDVDEVHQRVKSSKNGIDMEIDVLVVDEDFVILIEVKSTLEVEDVDEHLKRLDNFKYVFPLYKEKKVLGAVAGIILNSDVDKYAYRKGLFVITQKGEDVKILNDEKFKASEW